MFENDSTLSLDHKQYYPLKVRLMLLRELGIDQKYLIKQRGAMTKSNKVPIQVGALMLINQLFNNYLKI